MRKRPYKKEVEDILKLEEEVFLQRVTLAKQEKSSPFDMKELDEALNQLKKGKSRDHLSWVCDIFKKKGVRNHIFV